MLNINPPKKRLQDQIAKSLRLAYFPLFLTMFIILTGFNNPVPASRLVGIWESEEENLQIQMFEEKGLFCGRMIYYKCSSDEVMSATTDTENPDKSLRGRKLLGLELVTKLSYQGDDVWDDGKIYDPNSGNTFEARIHLVGPNTAIVRGYWKHRWFGRSMLFNRKS
jgi:uncharacterized protein (DUF2147 family)